jgi:antitoxin PrlF
MTIVDSTLTSKGQTTIPLQVREALKLKAGDKIRYVIEGDKVTLRVKNKRAVDLAGLLHDADREPVSVEDMKRSIVEAAADHASASR